MKKDNRLARIVKKLESYPEFTRKPLLNFALRNTVKLVGTAKVECLEMAHNKTVFRIKNRRKVQNHIGGVHAAGMALVAETASGMVVGMNVPDDKVPVIKSFTVDFKKRCKGDLTATATLTDEQIEKILTTEKGDVDVSVVCIDSEDKEPIQATMLWAWTPKRRK